MVGTFGRIMMGIFGRIVVGTFVRFVVGAFGRIVAETFPEHLGAHIDISELKSTSGSSNRRTGVQIDV